MTEDNHMAVIGILCLFLGFIIGASCIASGMTKLINQRIESGNCQIIDKKVWCE